MLKMGLAFLTTALLLHLLAGSRGLPAVLQARRGLERDAQALDRIRADNAALRREITRLREDAEAVEEVARRDLGYIAPGEKVFIIRDVTPADITPAAPTPEERTAPEVPATP
jgi:cell division protein FtsB